MLKVQAAQDQQRHLIEEKKRQDIRDNVRQKAIESMAEKDRMREINKQREEEHRNATRKRYLDDQKQAAEFDQMQRDQ